MLPTNGLQIEHTIVPGANGVKLHAAITGPRDRPVMLFLHGFPECWYAWHRQLLEFGRDYRAVALDLRGYNLSDKPRGKGQYVVQNIVDDIRAVIRAIAPSRPVTIVGHDWGGIATWSFLRESPELADRAIIINAPHLTLFRRELKHSAAQLFSSSYAGFFQLRGIAEFALRSFRFGALRAMLYKTSAKPEAFTPDLRAIYMDTWRQPYALTAGLNYYRNPIALDKEAKVAAAKRIEVPTLLLWGERDPALRLSNLAGLEKYVNHLTVKRHPTATHWIVHEETEWVNGAIRRFLQS